MRLIKRLLIIVFVLVLIVSGLIWADNKGYLKHPVFAKTSQLIKKIPIQNLTNVFNKKEANNDEQKLSNENLKKISEDVEAQAKILGQRAKETSEQVQQVLGESIQVNEDEENDKNMSTKALEYGRYLYCQTVVDEWEKAHLTD